jgi:hypothetical protein
MARTFIYQYFGNAAFQARVEDPNDQIPVPSIGDVILRRDQPWRVGLVTTKHTMTETGEETEYLVDLLPPE